MSKFKAGDLAVLLIDLSEIFFAGAVVELVDAINPGEIVVNSKTGRRAKAIDYGWICVRGNDDAAIGEKNLMPLRRDFQPEQQKAKGVEA